MSIDNGYRVPFKHRLARTAILPVFRVIFHLVADVKIFGTENIPFGQPYVVAINHISIYDPPFCVAFWPESLEVIGASDIWQKPGQGLLARLYGAFPVHRGEYDRNLLSQVLTALKAGHRLIIAPEGGRSHINAMRQAKPGIAYILDEAKVPVIPVGLIGTTSDFWQRARRGERPNLEMHIGKPMMMPAIEKKGAQRRNARQQHADLIMSHIAGMLPEDYRGVYATSAIFPKKTGQ